MNDNLINLHYESTNLCEIKILQNSNFKLFIPKNNFSRFFFFFSFNPNIIYENKKRKLAIIFLELDFMLKHPKGRRFPISTKTFSITRKLIIKLRFYNKGIIIWA